MNSEDFFPDDPFIRTLTPNDFNERIPWTLDGKGCMAVLFYCAWCPHCQNFKETWKRISKKMGEIQIASFNCAKYSQYQQNAMNRGSELVKGYPTIVFYSNGVPKMTYTGDRAESVLFKAIMDFCNSK